MRSDGARQLVSVLQRTTRVYIAARVGVHPSEVSRWTSGERIPTARHRAALHANYGIPVESWTLAALATRVGRT